MANAFRCGRLHCWLTGPFCLTAAVASVILWSDVLGFGQSGADLFAIAVVVTGLVSTTYPNVLAADTLDTPPVNPRPAATTFPEFLPVSFAGRSERLLIRNGRLSFMIV